MATISHKNLTGLQLHENKGVASATNGQVATADGAGSTVWKKLDSSNLSGTGNPFGAQLLHVREEQVSGVYSGTGFAATNNVCVLNTVKTNEISSATLSSNTVSLPAGTYFAWGTTNVFHGLGPNQAGSSRVHLQNTTAGTQLVIGTNAYTQNGAAQALYPTHFLQLRGRFTLASTSNIQMQVYVLNGASAMHPFSGVGNEVYSELQIWKVA